jgi:hypothetical protein
VDELMQVMTEHRIRHVPVLTDGRLSGIISIGDVVKSSIGELEFERDQLDNSLHQTRPLPGREAGISDCHPPIPGVAGGAAWFSLPDAAGAHQSSGTGLRLGGL